MSDNKYPHKCPTCTSPAYEGATAVECTNQKCVHWDGNGPAELAPFEGMLIGWDGAAIWRCEPKPGAPKAYWTGVDHELKGADGGDFYTPCKTHDYENFWYTSAPNAFRGKPIKNS